MGSRLLSLSQWADLDFRTGYRLTAMPLQAHMGRTKVATVHGNTDTVTRLVDAINEHTTDSASVYYVNKGKTTNAIQRAGNPIPGGLNDLDGFTASISESRSVVKNRIKDATQSQQFKRT